MIEETKGKKEKTMDDFSSSSISFDVAKFKSFTR